MDGTETLQSALAAAQRTFPGISLDFDGFQRRVHSMGVRPEDLERRSDDIFLAAACVEGDATAIDHFDRAFLSKVDAHVARFRLDDMRLADLRQQLRLHLLCGPQPRLSRYSGRAPLQLWIRVVAMRTAMDLIEREEREVAIPEALEDLVAAHASPEVLAVKQDLRGAFQDALREALAALAPPETTLLRLHFVDQLSVDAIARIYRIHKATAARRLVALRERIFDDIRRNLALDLRPSPSEVRSLFRLVKSDIHVSLQRLLASNG